MDVTFSIVTFTVGADKEMKLLLIKSLKSNFPSLSAPMSPSHPSLPRMQEVQIIPEYHCAKSGQIHQRVSPRGLAEMLSFLTFTGKIKSLAASWRERRIILLWGLYSTWCTSSKSIRKYGEGSAAPSCYVNCWTIWKLVGADFKEFTRMEVICWNLYLFVIMSCLSTQDYKYLCWKNVSMHMINYMVFLIIIQMWCLLVPTTQLLRGHD